MSKSATLCSEATITDVVQEAVDLCLVDGMLPAQAARAVSLDALGRDDVHSLAAVGLTRLVSNMMAAYNNQLTAEATTTAESTPNVSTLRSTDGYPSRATPEERRQLLYLKAKDVLDCRYAGADGVMKTLATFTAADHKYRLAHCDATSRGWRTASRFHHEALTALKAFDAATINDLPNEEKARLRGRLT